MGIQINGQTDTITAVDGSLTISGADLPTVTNLNATGIVTATSFSGPLTGNVTGNLTGTASTATAAATAYGLSGSPTLSGITSVSTTNLTVNGNAYPSDGPLSNRNLIINGAMQVAQRSTSTTGSSGGGYLLCDRWTLFDNSGSVDLSQSTTVPIGQGFSNSFQQTVNTTGSLSPTSVYCIVQSIEGFNTANLMLGTANAKSFTISFWCRSSVTGTYGIFIRNSAADRFYNTTFLISVADTWQKVEVTIPGDTSGTWIGSTNGIGLTFGITLRAGSSRVGTSEVWSSNSHYSSSFQTDWHGTAGATFYLTGVQLEAGTVATPFEHRSYGQELALCQRYLIRKTIPEGQVVGRLSVGGLLKYHAFVFLPNNMRANPSISTHNIIVRNEGGSTTAGVLDFFGVQSYNTGGEIGLKYDTASQTGLKIVVDNQFITLDAEL